MKAIQAYINHMQFAKDICELMGVDPNDVTEMTINILPNKPLSVTYKILTDEICDVKLPTLTAMEYMKLKENT